jgi:hypothetical protein
VLACASAPIATTVAPASVRLPRSTRPSMRPPRTSIWSPSSSAVPDAGTTTRSHRLPYPRSVPRSSSDPGAAPRISNEPSAAETASVSSRSLPKSCATWLPSAARSSCHAASPISRALSTSTRVCTTATPPSGPPLSPTNRPRTTVGGTATRSIWLIAVSSTRTDMDGRPERSNAKRRDGSRSSATPGESGCGNRKPPSASTRVNAT